MRLLGADDISDALTDGVIAPWQSDIYRGWDGQGGGDSLAAYGTGLTTYSDYSTQPEDFTYTFTPAQVSLLAGHLATDGSFGIGFDPDCHYNNCGVALTLTTTTIPAPGACLLAGIGASLVGYLRRRRAF